MKKSIVLLTFTISSFLFNGCSSTKKVDPAIKSPIYKKAYNDGCTTAKGTYTKNHYAFNNSKIYYDGWFAGRHDCKNND